MQIQAKPTAYNGYLFRSKLEAKWAVFFDMLHIPYVYEPEAFVCFDGSQYTPDFYLPKSYLRDRNAKGVYLEIKPDYWQDETNFKRRIESAFFEKANLLLLRGDPLFFIQRDGNQEEICPHTDSEIDLMHCEKCGVLKFDHAHTRAYRCVVCGGEVNGLMPDIAAETARSYSFRYIKATHAKH